MVSSNSAFAMKLLQNQLKCKFLLFIFLALDNNEFGINAGLEDDNNMFVWALVIDGPKGSLYEVRYSQTENFRVAISKQF